MDQSDAEQAELREQNTGERAHDRATQAAEDAFRAEYEANHPTTLWGSLMVGPWDYKIYSVIRWALTYGITWRRLDWVAWPAISWLVYWQVWWLAIGIGAFRLRSQLGEDCGSMLEWCKKNLALLPVSFIFAHARRKVNRDTYLRRDCFCQGCDARKKKKLRVWVRDGWWVRRETITRMFCIGRDINQQGCGCPDTRASSIEHRIELWNAECIMGRWPRGNVENKLERS